MVIHGVGEALAAASLDRPDLADLVAEVRVGAVRNPSLTTKPSTARAKTKAT